MKIVCSQWLMRFIDNSLFASYSVTYDLSWIFDTTDNLFIYCCFPKTSFVAVPANDHELNDLKVRTSVGCVIIGFVTFW